MEGYLEKGLLPPLQHLPRQYRQLLPAPACAVHVHIEPAIFLVRVGIGIGGRGTVEVEELAVVVLEVLVELGVLLCEGRELEEVVCAFVCGMSGWYVCGRGRGRTI